MQILAMEKQLQINRMIIYLKKWENIKDIWED